MIHTVKYLYETEPSCNGNNFGLLRFGYGQFSLYNAGKVHNMFFFTSFICFDTCTPYDIAF